MRVLVTGATGFVGSRLAQALVGGGHEVGVLVRPTTDLARLGAARGAVTVLPVGEISVADQVARFAPLDGAIHLATEYGRSGNDWPRVLEANLALPTDVFAALRRHGGRFFISVSSYYAKFLPFSTPLPAYTFSKRLWKTWAELAARDGPTAHTDVVLEHVYGPGDREDKFLPQVFRALRQNVARLPLTAGTQRLDFIYVDDAIDALCRLMEEVGPGRPAPSVELGTGRAVELREFIRAARDISGARTALAFGEIPYTGAEIMHSEATPSVLNSLGWQPSVAMAEGIERSLCQS